MRPANDAPGLIFGIYPGGLTADETDTPIGVADDPGRVQDALTQLKPAHQPFVIRGYFLYDGSGKIEHEVPANVEQYLAEGRLLDLVLCFRLPDGNLNDWINFVRGTVRHHGAHLSMLQIAEEPNSTGPAGDGRFPGSRQAVVEGVMAAKEEARRLELDIQVGFNAALDFNPKADFWQAIAQLSSPAFVSALDYVGLDFFPDVFRPVAPDGSPNDLRDTVRAVLGYFRNVNLVAGNIPVSVPLHITEHGWPTGPTRSYERQSIVLETVIRTIYEHRVELNVTHYEHFDLRDADSANPNVFFQFGLLRDDYTPKPAFETFRRLVAELGSHTG